MMKAIREIPVPSNITQMRSFFRLVNQANFAFSMKEMMASFREQLGPSAEFYWDEKFQKLFEEAREKVVKKVEAGVKIFEVDRVTRLGQRRGLDSSGFKSIVAFKM